MDPITRREQYYAKMSGDDVEIPDPITREEQYLKKIAENGGGGGDTPLPAGGTTGQVLKKKSNADNDVEWGDDGGGTPLPSGGTTGQVLKKKSNADNDVEWGDDGGGTPLPTGGTTGQVLKKKSNADNDVEWSDESGSGGGGVLVPTGTSISVSGSSAQTFTPSADDAEKCVAVAISGSVSYTPALFETAGTASFSDLVVPLYVSSDSNNTRYYKGVVTVTGSAYNSSEAQIEITIIIKINKSSLASSNATTNCSIKSCIRMADSKMIWGPDAEVSSRSITIKPLKIG